MAKLTAKQQAWVDYYKQGKRAADAARLAGYKAKNDEGFHSIGAQNYRKLQVYIQDRDEVLASPRIADMDEINSFWTEIILNSGETTNNRLKASELRARSVGAFIDKMEVSTPEPMKIEVDYGDDEGSV